MKRVCPWEDRLPALCLQGTLAFWLPVSPRGLPGLLWELWFLDYSCRQDDWISCVDLFIPAKPWKMQDCLLFGSLAKAILNKELMMPFVKWLNLFFSLLSTAPLPVPFPLLCLPCGLMKSDAGSLGGIGLWQFKAQFRWSDHVIAAGEVQSGNSDLELDEHLVCHMLSQPALSSHCLFSTWIAKCQPSSWISVLSPHVNYHAEGWSCKTMEEIGLQVLSDSNQTPRSLYSFPSQFKTGKVMAVHTAGRSYWLLGML